MSGDGTGVRAAAALEAERLPGTGGTRLPVLRSAPPITLRRTAPDQVHLVGTTAGPVGGDELALTVRLGPGAALRVASVAATLAYPGPSGRRSSFHVTADVGPGARLAWETEPTVLVRGCDHEATADLRLADRASLLWREVVVLGRHDEPTGSLLQRLRVDRAGRPLVRNDLAVGPAWPGSLGPAGVGDARSVATALVVGPRAAALRVEPGAHPPAIPIAEAVHTAVLSLADDAALVCVVAEAPGLAMVALDRILRAGAPLQAGSPCSASAAFDQRSSPVSSSPSQGGATNASASSRLGNSTSATTSPSSDPA
jgi:urease accessory protein